MTNIRIENEFFLNFPQQANATTQALWQNLAIAAAGIELNEGGKKTAADQQNTMMGKYTQYVTLYLVEYDEVIPATFNADQTLMRMNFHSFLKKKVTKIKNY